MRISVLFVRSLIPLSWTFGNVSPWLQSQGWPLTCMLHCCVQWIPQIQLWCDTCWPLDGQHCSQAFFDSHTCTHTSIAATWTRDRVCHTVGTLTIWATPAVWSLKYSFSDETLNDSYRSIVDRHQDWKPVESDTDEINVAIRWRNVRQLSTENYDSIRIPSTVCHREFIWKSVHKPSKWSFS